MLKLLSGVRGYGDVEVYSRMNLKDYTPRMAEDTQETCPAGTAPCEQESYLSCSWVDDRGIGVVEMILILVVLIALVALFKEQLKSLVETILATIQSNAGEVMN